MEEVLFRMKHNVIQEHEEEVEETKKEKKEKKSSTHLRLKRLAEINQDFTDDLYND